MTEPKRKKKIKKPKQRYIDSPRYQLLRAQFAPKVLKVLSDFKFAHRHFETVGETAAAAAMKEIYDHQTRFKQFDPRNEKKEHAWNIPKKSETRLLKEKSMTRSFDRLKGALFTSDHYTEKANIVFDAFARMIDPTLDRAAGKGGKFLHWACQDWLDHPYMIEDLYKTKDRLHYFETQSARLHKDGRKNRIQDIEDSWKLEELMRPYEMLRDQKQAERAARHMPPEIKDQINNETTMIYDGPEGRIVMPHTMFASQYWGAQTQWCISAEDRKNAFEGYNEENSVIIYLPKPTKADIFNHADKYSSFKYAAVDGIYDERDHVKHKGFTEGLQTLVRAATEALPENQAQWLIRNGQCGTICTEFVPQKQAPTRVKTPNKYKKQLEECKRIGDIPLIAGRISKRLSMDKDFCLFALKNNLGLYGFSIYMHSGLKTDPDIAFCMLQRDPKMFRIYSRHLSDKAKPYTHKVLSKLKQKTNLVNDEEKFSALLLKNGYGLSREHFYPDLVGDLYDYAIDVISIACQHNGATRITDDLRHFKEFWGDLETLTCAKTALKKLTALQAEKQTADIIPTPAVRKSSL